MASTSSSSRGALIVLEGLDRSGKSTQVSNLVHTLNAQGILAQAVRFPDRSTAIGSTINAYLASGTDLDDHAIHLLFSANRWEVARSMETLLRQGTTLIVDRYSFSGVAFTHAKLNPSLTLEWCINPDIGLLSPDLVLFLNVSPQAAQTRAGFGQERYESADMQQRVRTAFEKVADHVKGIDWIQIDADQSMDQVGLDIQTHVAKVLQQVKADGKDIKWDLWSSSTSENV